MPTRNVFIISQEVDRDFDGQYHMKRKPLF